MGVYVCVGGFFEGIDLGAFNQIMPILNGRFQSGSQRQMAHAVAWTWETDFLYKKIRSRHLYGYY
jgi:hypothetical protein